jgi:hypothetical protein
VRKPDYSGDEMNLFYRKITLLVSFGFASAAPPALDFGVNRIHFNARASLDLEATNNRDGFIKLLQLIV